MNKKSPDFMIFLFFHDTNHVVNGQSSVLMLKVQGLHIECPVQGPAVLNPKCSLMVFCIEECKAARGQTDNK